MAINAKKAVSLQMRLIDGEGENGAPKYVARSFSGINPEAAGEDLLKAVKALGSLMAKPMASASRVEKSDLAEDDAA